MADAALGKVLTKAAILRRMSRLVLVNGAPGTGKSTVAAELAARRPMALALDIDQIKHNLGRWADDAIASGLQARRLAIAMAGQHLAGGHDVFVGQYLARTDFIDELDALAARQGAEFVEVLLRIDAATLAGRLTARRERPDRAEHLVNNELVGPADAARLIASVEEIPHLRPDTRVVDATGTLTDVVERVETAIDTGSPAEA